LWRLREEAKPKRQGGIDDISAALESCRAGSLSRVSPLGSIELSLQVDQHFLERRFD
jgi:hypothetical protein